jgi:hypothetical protein
MDEAKTKPDGFKYWSYILVYTDDLLVVNHKPKVIMDYMASCYTLKPGSVMECDFTKGVPPSFLKEKKHRVYCLL